MLALWLKKLFWQIILIQCFPFQATEQCEIFYWQLLLTGMYNQGDQIGRIFAYYAFVYFSLDVIWKWQNKDQIFSYFFHFINLTKSGVGYILGELFANSSGHPEYNFSKRSLTELGSMYQSKNSM
jgi:hypothetical protein